MLELVMESMEDNIREFNVPEIWSTPVLVTWIDAYGMGIEVPDSKNLGGKEPCIRRSMGFVVAMDEEYLYIAATDDRGWCHNSGGDCSDVNAIAWGMVKRVDDLVITPREQVIEHKKPKRKPRRRTTKRKSR